MNRRRGDRVDILGKSYHTNTTNITNANSTLLDLSALMANLLLGPGNGAAAKGISAATLNTMNTGLVPSTFFRGNNNEATTQVPKAYINYIFFDEQFKYVGGSFSRVGGANTVKDHWQTDAQLQNISVPKNGYLFVYVSNESNFNVYFDNLQIVHKPGAIQEEAHYYPYGMKMAAISTKAFSAVNNPYQYQGDYSDFDEETGWNDFYLRSYDAQTGLWTKADPYDQFASPYIGMGNDPVNGVDPNGGIMGYILNAAPSLMGNALANYAGLSGFFQQSLCPDCPTGRLAKPVTLPEIIIRKGLNFEDEQQNEPSKKVSPFSWPLTSRETYDNWVNNQGLIRDRQNSGLPLLQENDPPGLY